MVSTNISLLSKEKRFFYTCSMTGPIPFGCKFKKIQLLYALFLLVSPCGVPQNMCQTAKKRGYSWDRAIYMWKQYLQYRVQTISRERVEARRAKREFFHGLPNNRPVFSNTDITLSYGARFLTHKHTKCLQRACESKKYSPLALRAIGDTQIQPLSQTFALETRRTSFAAAFQTRF